MGLYGPEVGLYEFALLSMEPHFELPKYELYFDLEERMNGNDVFWSELD